MKSSENSNKVIWLALIPIGGAAVMILAVALVVRSQLGSLAQVEPPIPQADRVVLDDLEPLHRDDSNDKP